MLNKACGLVGYPNVGKSTLFNAFVGSTVAAAENYPFCTVEPNTIKVPVPDPRLETLSKVCASGKVVQGTVEIRDIAGLIKGAASGAGMGNEFLSQIRGVQVVLHVVRCFSDAAVVHVEDPVNIDPIAEYESILEELVIADLELASRRLPALRKKAINNAEMTKMLPIYEAALAALEDGKPAREAFAGADDVGAEPSDDFLRQLITAKPTVVLCNVKPEDAATGNEYTERLIAHVSAGESSKGTVVGRRSCKVVSATLEAEIAEIDDDEFRVELLESYGLQGGERALPRVLNECQDLLNLVSYLTVGDIEARAWFVPKGSKAHQAAGAIHTDFVKNFEQAEVWAYDDVVALGGKSAVRKAGKVKQKGKDYEVRDGDVMEFRIKGGRS